MNPEHFMKLVKDGVKTFNQWRENNPAVQPDLSEADLSGADLRDVDLSGANLRRACLTGGYLEGASLREAYLNEADLSIACLDRAHLRGALLGRVNLSQAYLTGADLLNADLSEADLSRTVLDAANLSRANLSRSVLVDASLMGANLSQAYLRGADLSGADLSNAILVETDLEEANLTSCSVYGISAWNVHLTGATQSNLVITPDGESKIQVDNLEVAQFIYLLLNNEKIRDVIDTITSKVVLILGRFTPERKAVLDAIREELRHRNYLPVLFDFEKPASRNFTETISTLAHMARFVIADLTDPRSIPQELTAIIPHLPSVPVQPLVLASQTEYGMFPDFSSYSWVLEPFRYRDQRTLLAELGQRVIEPAENKAKELSGPKTRLPDPNTMP